MFFKNKNRRLLEQIEKKIEYQTKLLESIFETIDESKFRADNKKKEMVNFFDSLMASFGGLGGNLNAPIMKPLNDMLEALKNGR